MLLKENARPAKAFRRVPFLIPINWQTTDIEPCRSIYTRLGEMECASVPSLSFAPGFPAADFPGCGPTVFAYGKDQKAADAAAQELYGLVCAREADFGGRIYTPEDGVQEAIRLSAGSSKPVLIADTQDNPGAGGNSDTMGMLFALLDAGATRAAFGAIWDPAAAQAAHAAGLGAEIVLVVQT
jgi:microcystin degradation protein MlrC